MPDDLKLDPVTRDLDLSTGDLVIITDLDALAQNLRVRLQMVKGEWFLDQRLGVPYFDVVFVKSPDLQLIASTMQRTILATDGVNKILTYKQDLATNTRTLTVTFSVDTTFGTVTITEGITL